MMKNKNQVLVIWLMFGMLCLALGISLWAGQNGITALIGIDVEGVLYYWACGLMIFLLAGGMVCRMTHSDHTLKLDHRRKGGGKTG